MTTRRQQQTPGASTPTQQVAEDLAHLTRHTTLQFIARGIAMGLGGAYLGPLFDLGTWDNAHLVALATVTLTLFLSIDARRMTLQAFVTGHHAAWREMARVIERGR